MELTQFFSTFQITEDSIFVTEQGERLSEESANLLGLYLEKVHNGPTQLDSKPEESLGEWAERLFWQKNDENPIHPDKKVCYGALDWVHRFLV
jgi:hypothetical protein